jgi:hypothetical protein
MLGDGACNGEYGVTSVALNPYVPETERKLFEGGSGKERKLFLERVSSPKVLCRTITMTM